MARGWYVPADTDSERPEQRILEQGIRVAGTFSGVVGGWAALRWRGAAFFDGRSMTGVAQPVPLLRIGGGSPTRQGRAHLSSAHIGPTETDEVAGLPIASVQRAVFDEMRFAPSARTAVVPLDMAAAAGLISVDLFRAYVGHRPSWTGVPQVRVALALASNHSRSPQETRLRVLWLVDAELPPPLVNQPVFDLGGNLIGYPDLLDEEAGLVVEYDGADHRRTERRRRDVSRADAFRDVGLEVVEVVGGQLSNRPGTVDRLLAARRRARFAAPSRRRWTLQPPPWWPVEPTLDERLARAGLVPSLLRF
ncbi:MAG: hypothetical protein U0R80_13215 [Nocardioidaceae bacterium]